MRPVLVDTDAFLAAPAASSWPLLYGQTAAALWWRMENPHYRPGATWWLLLHERFERESRSGPAVVDDFGDLVLVENVR